MKQRKLLYLLNIALLFFPFLLLGQNMPNEEPLHFQLAANPLSVQAIGESSLEKRVANSPAATLFTWNFSEGDGSASTGIRMNFENTAENVCFSLLSHAVMFMTAQKTVPPLRIQGFSPTGAVVTPLFIFNEGLHSQKELLYYDQLLDESVGVYFKEPVKSIQLSVVGTVPTGNIHTIDIGDIHFLKVPNMPVLPERKCEGWNVLFLTDVSGSISASDRDLFVKNLKWLLFASGRTIQKAGFMGFGTDAHLDLPMMDVAPNRAKIEKHLTQMYQTHSKETDLTNWTNAFQIVDNQLNTQKIDLIVLMTDGLPNVVQAQKASVSASLESVLTVLNRIQAKKIPIELVWSDKARFVGARPVLEWLTGQSMTEKTDKSNLIESWKGLTPDCKTISYEETVHAAIFPNPAQTQLTVSLSSALKSDMKASVSIVNLQGTVVSLPSQETFGTYYFDVSGLVNGVYFVTVQWENGKKTNQKVLITN